MRFSNPVLLAVASLTSHEVHATPSLLPPRSGTTPTALKVIQRQSTNFTRFTLPNFSNDSLRAAQLYVKSPILAAWVLWALRPPPPPTFLLDQRPEPGKDFLNVKAAWILITNASDFNRAETRGGFLYGPAVAGGPYYPAGTIGEAVAGEDLLELEVEFNAQAALAQIALESAEGNATIGAYGNLSTIDDYLLLYDQWKDTWPQGLVPGVASNYSQDLFFSMERLSVNPYAVRRLEPSNATLPFTISDSDAQATSGTTLQGLLEDGRLFYIDHSAQAKLNRTSAYAAACDAYFYIDDVSGDFLPLAIRTGVGANLIYTPQDEANDWLLAKMMFNGNDVFFAQFNHLAATHEVVQIVWMAAIRTLSTEHPIYGLLDRLTFQVFGVQPIAEGILFATGAAVDQIFGYTGAAAQNFTTDLYFGSQGRFQANYFLTDLQNRGLINSTFGPELSNFPFFEDASVIYHAIEAFMTSFVDSYYPSNLDVKTDFEVQSWAMDANVNAEVLDFPVTIATKEELVAILTHIAHLVSTAHHAVNTNELMSISMTLPFHPAALHSPLPTTKGNTSVIDYLPAYEQAFQQLYAAAYFARPLLVDTNRTLVDMFNDDAMLAQMNADVTKAAATFKSTMEAFSDEVSARAFDADGLSQGMPFLWQALDPRIAPFSLTI